MPVVAVLLLTSVFAVLTVAAPFKHPPSAPPVLPLPNIPSCYEQGQNMTQRQINACLAKDQAALVQYQQALKAFELQPAYLSQLAIYNDQLSIYNGYLSNIVRTWMLATASAVLFLFALSVAFPQRRSVRVLALLALLGGSLVFAFWAGVDFTDSPARAWRLYPFLRGVGMFLGDNNLLDDGMGLSAVSSFCIAMAGFMAFRVKKGIVRAVSEGLILFAAPVIALFEFGIWHYTPEYFSLQVTNFTPWLTNGQVFVMASCLAVAGYSTFLIRFLVRKEVAREERFLSRAGFGP